MPVNHCISNPGKVVVFGFFFSPLFGLLSYLSERRGVMQSVVSTPAGPCVPTAKLMEKRSRICNFAAILPCQDKLLESDGLRGGWARRLLLYISAAWGVGFKPVFGLLRWGIFSSLAFFSSPLFSSSPALPKNPVEGSSIYWKENE